MSAAQDSAKQRFVDLTEINREIDRLAALGEVEFELELPAAAERLAPLGVRAIKRQVVEARKRSAATAEAKAEAVAPDDGRPTIEVRGGAIHEEVDAAEAALIASEAGIYQRGEMLVRTGIMRVGISSRTTSDGKMEKRSTEGMQIVQVNEPCLAESMTRAARWIQRAGKAKKFVEINAPKSHAPTLLDRVGRWNLPVLSGIVSAPTLRADGSILDTPGYDAETGLIFDPRGVEFPPVPAAPTMEEGGAALDRIKRLISTFPFVTDADRSIALSCLLTATVRRSLKTAPAHCFSAPTAGTGKSKLADIASILATGREAGAVPGESTGEEFTKQLSAMLIAGEPVINIDNRVDPLGGALLCQTLTAERVRVRILGFSKMPEVPTGSLITANGNNLVLEGDMNRRALVASMDAGCERPELRAFDNDPVEDAKEQRAELVVAALTVLRAYHIAGRPNRTNPLGSFPDWSLWVRDALLWLGEADPVETMEQNRRADPKLDKLTTIMDAWQRTFGADPTTAKTAIQAASTTQDIPQSMGPPKREPVNPDLRDALLLLGTRGDLPTSIGLGTWLRENQRRIANGQRFMGFR